MSATDSNIPSDSDAHVGCPSVSGSASSEFDGMSESDIDAWRLTGVKPAPQEQRQCVMCKEMGHYYYECNNGEFFRSIGPMRGMPTKKG